MFNLKNIKIQKVFINSSGGTHVHKEDCQESQIVSTIEELLKKSDLYPETIKLISGKVYKPTFTGNGGWGDKRDHELCINMTMS